MKCQECGHDNAAGAPACGNCGAALTSPTNPLEGQLVGGRYRIVEQIGEGGMGVVYRAEQQLGSTVRNVAVKTLHSHFSKDPAVTARFHREVGTVAQLEHPNTVRVYDFGATEDGTLYIAMEFLAGASLGETLRREGPFDVARTAHILRQIGGSLDEAHARGIVHRDLKPENVLLIERAGERDVVKLVDFGIAARTEATDQQREQKLTQQGTVLGTPPYMSPEQFTGQALDARSDVYSVGVMAYEMLTGTLPFEGQTPWQWATAHMTQAPRAFETIPDAKAVPVQARQAVLRALSKEPADRQSSAGEFHEEFSSRVARAPASSPSPATEAMAQSPAGPPDATQAMPAVADAPVAIPVPPAPARSKSRDRPSGLVLGLSAVTGVLLLAMGVVAFGGGDDDDSIAPISLDKSASAGLEPASVGGSLAAASTPELAANPGGASAAAVAETTPPEAAPAESAPKPKPAAKKPDPKPAAASPPPKPKAPAPKRKAPRPAAPKPPASRPKPAPGVDPCRACSAAAKRGDLDLAAAQYSRCNKPTERSSCQRTAAAKARSRAKSEAFNGNCARAKEIVASAQKLGVGRSVFREVLTTCP